MTRDEFQASLDLPAPPDGLAPALEILWRDARGDWDGAHRVAQGQPDADGAWLHAYLHRKEGDLSNAGYWYRRAGRDMPRGPLAEEWDALAHAFTDD